MFILSQDREGIFNVNNMARIYISPYIDRAWSISILVDEGSNHSTNTHVLATYANKDRAMYVLQAVCRFINSMDTAHDRHRKQIFELPES